MLKALRNLGKAHTSTLVVIVCNEDGFIVSLAENIARRGYRSARVSLARDPGCHQAVARQAVHSGRQLNLTQLEGLQLGVGNGVYEQPQHHHRR